MNRVLSVWSRSKFVMDRTSEAMIGPSVNRSRPISHGPMKMRPQIASRTDGRSPRRGFPGRVCEGSSSSVAVMACVGLLGGGGWLDGECVPGGRCSARDALGGGLRVGDVVVVEDALEGRLQGRELGIDVETRGR